MDDFATLRARYGWRQPLKVVGTPIGESTLGNTGQDRKLGRRVWEKPKPFKATEQTKKHSVTPKHLRNMCKDIFCIKPHLQHFDNKENMDTLENIITGLMSFYMNLCDEYKEENDVTNTKTPAQNNLTKDKIYEIEMQKSPDEQELSYLKKKYSKPKFSYIANNAYGFISKHSGELTKKEDEKNRSQKEKPQYINLKQKYPLHTITLKDVLSSGGVIPKVTSCRDIRCNKSSMKDLREQIIRLSVIKDRKFPCIIREAQSDTCILTHSHCMKRTHKLQLPWKRYSDDDDVNNCKSSQILIDISNESDKSNILYTHLPKKSAKVCFCGLSTNLQNSEEIEENKKKSQNCINNGSIVIFNKENVSCCGDALIQKSALTGKNEKIKISSSLQHLKTKLMSVEKEDILGDKIDEYKCFCATKNIETVSKITTSFSKNRNLLSKFERKVNTEKNSHFNNTLCVNEIRSRQIGFSERGQFFTQHFEPTNIYSFLINNTRSEAITQLIEESLNQLGMKYYQKGSKEQLIDKASLSDSFCLTCFNKCISEHSVNVVGESSQQYLTYGKYKSSLEIADNERPPKLASCAEIERQYQDKKVTNPCNDKNYVMKKGKFWKGGKLFERRSYLYNQRGNIVIKITPTDWCGLMYQQIKSNSRVLRFESGNDLTLTKKRTYKKKNSTYKHTLHTHTYSRFKTKMELHINLIEQNLELGHHPQFTTMACKCKNNQEIGEEITRPTEGIGLLYEEDDDYCETYMDQLTENGENEDNKPLTKCQKITPSLPEIIVDTDMCNSRMEIPWLKITLPPSGYYEIQKMEGHPKTICDCWNVDKRDSVLSAKADEPVDELKCTCDEDNETAIAPEVYTGKPPPEEKPPEEEEPPDEQKSPEEEEPPVEEKSPAEENPQEEDTPKFEIKPEPDNALESDGPNSPKTDSTPFAPSESDAPPESDEPYVPNEVQAAETTSILKSSLKSASRSESGNAFEYDGPRALEPSPDSEANDEPKNAPEVEIKTDNIPENAAAETIPESLVSSNISPQSDTAEIIADSETEPEPKTQSELGEPNVAAVDLAINDVPDVQKLETSVESAEPKECTCQKQNEDCPTPDEFFIPSPTKFVYDWPCDSTNEGYMDPIYRMYPDDCDKKCGPQTEIPWNDIILPTNIRLRATRKPKSAAQNEAMQLESGATDDTDNSQQQPGVEADKQVDSTLEIQLSFTEIGGQIVDVKCEAPLQQDDGNTACQKDYIIRVHATGCCEQQKVQGTGLKAICAPPCNVLGQTVGSEVVITIRTPQNDKQSTNKPLPIEHAKYETTDLEECKCEAVAITNNDNGVMGTMYKETLNIETPDRQTQIVTEGAYMSVNCQCACDVEQSTKPAEESQPSKNKSSSIKESQVCICKDPVMTALETYQAEMEPLRDTLNEIRTKIRSLNIPELNDWNSSSRNQNPTNSGKGCSFRTARTITKMKPPMHVPFGPPPPSSYGIGPFPPNQFGYPPPGMGQVGGIPLGTFGPPSPFTYPPNPIPPKYSPPSDKRTRDCCKCVSSKIKKKKKSNNRCPSSSDVSDYDSDSCPFLSALRQYSAKSVCDGNQSKQKKSKKSSSNSNLKESKRKRGKKRSQEALREGRCVPLKTDTKRNRPKYQDNETDTEPEVQIHYGPKSPRVVTKQVFRGFIDEGMATAKTQRLRIAVRVTPSGQKMLANDDFAIEDVDECNGYR